jgi:indolepyruvate ferredoxin oxidoreductase alpha subunit
MMAYGFEISEKLNVPVLLRITTRLAHSRAVVNCKEQKEEQNPLHLPGDLKQFILLPSIARNRYELLLDNQARFVAYSSGSDFNTLSMKGANLGVVCCGLGYNYFMEVFEQLAEPFNLLKISQYPLPVDKIEEIAAGSKELLIIEEGYSFVEEMLRGFFNRDNPVKIKGRMDGLLPRSGELNPGKVAEALEIRTNEHFSIPGVVKSRPPALCKGCSHADMYFALNEALEDYGKGRTFSDIGCYTLGALPPYNSINTCVDMGASITMAKGAADAGLLPSVAVIGDSTFTHSGMTGLLDAVNQKTPITLIISDNSTTGMTGGQTSSATGKIEAICLGIGVEKDHLHTISPLKRDHDHNVDIIKKELDYMGVSVIIAQRECIQTAKRRRKSESLHES